MGSTDCAHAWLFPRDYSNNQPSNYICFLAWRIYPKVSHQSCSPFKDRWRTRCYFCFSPHICSLWFVSEIYRRYSKMELFDYKITSTWTFFINMWEKKNNNSLYRRGFCSLRWSPAHAEINAVLGKEDNFVFYLFLLIRLWWPKYVQNTQPLQNVLSIPVSSL